jgi:transcriptional pleiotropic regulator of transition state genes
MEGKKRKGAKNMKSTGIVRGIDGLGRIVLPKELRTSLKISSNSKLEIFVDGDTILLKKYRPAGACDFCGEIDPNAKNYNGTCICSACRKKIGNL